MTDEHKAALAMGRNEGNAVRNYLEALRSNKPKRGRRRTRESIAGPAGRDRRRARDGRSDERAAAAPGAPRSADRNGRRSASKVDISALEEGFVAVAKSYSARQGISYATWREIGVDAAVLKRAGITRSD